MPKLPFNDPNKKPDPDENLPEFIRNEFEREKQEQKGFWYIPENWEGVDPEKAPDAKFPDFKNRHYKQALANLSKKSGKSGPFSLEEFSRAVMDVVGSEDLWHFVQKEWLEISIDENGEFVFTVTKLGYEMSEKLRKKYGR